MDYDVTNILNFNANKEPTKFKYIKEENFERIIKAVQKDRVKPKRDFIWDQFCNNRPRSSLNKIKLITKSECSTGEIDMCCLNLPNVSDNTIDNIIQTSIEEVESTNILDLKTENTKLGECEDLYYQSLKYDETNVVEEFAFSNNIIDDQQQFFINSESNKEMALLPTSTLTSRKSILILSRNSSETHLNNFEKINNVKGEEYDEKFSDNRDDLSMHSNKIFNNSNLNEYCDNNIPDNELISNRDDLSMHSNKIFNNSNLNEYWENNTPDNELISKDFKELKKKEIKLHNKTKISKKIMLLSKISNFQQQIAVNIDLINSKYTAETLQLYMEVKNQSAEFINRFNCGYLYQTSKLISDVKCITSSRNSSSELDMINKILQIYKLILYALKSYLNNIYSFTLKEACIKLRFLMNLIINGNNISIQKKIFDKNDIIVQNLFDKSLNFLKYLQYLEKFEIKKVELLKLKNKETCCNPKTISKKQHSTNKLSMYESAYNKKCPPKKKSNKRKQVANTTKTREKLKNPKSEVYPIVNDDFQEDFKLTNNISTMIEEIADNQNTIINNTKSESDSKNPSNSPELVETTDDTDTFNNEKQFYKNSSLNLSAPVELTNNDDFVVVNEHKVIDTTNKNQELRGEEKLLRYSKNIVYTFLKSSHEKQIKEKENILEDDDDNNNYEDENRKELLLNEIYKIRENFFKKIINNFLYVNANFSNPWKIVSKISDQLLNESILSIQNEIEKQESDIISMLLNMELNS